MSDKQQNSDCKKFPRILKNKKNEPPKLTVNFNNTKFICDSSMTSSSIQL